MKNIVRTECIILKKFPYKENDLFVILFCKDVGKVVAKAKGGLKINSRWGNTLETMNLLKVNLYKKSEYFYITEAKVIDSFLGIKKDIEKSLVAMEILRVIDKTQTERNDLDNLFEILKVSLKNIEKEDEILKDYYQFLLKLLSFEGVLFPMDKCIKCGKKLNPPIIFDSKETGFVCSNCASNSIKILSDETWNLFKNLLKRDLTKYETKESIFRDIFEILYISYKNKLGVEIKNFEF